MNNGCIIEKIEITAFGKLSDVSIRPGDGINLLLLENEGGKSTLAAFLKYVFYGFTGTKKQSVSENEKTKYMPWSGNAASGSVTVCKDGKHYRIQRKTAPKDDSVTVTDTQTGDEVFKGQVPGVAILGLNEDTFAKTLFVGRPGSVPNGDATLAESLRNLLFSADEKTNADKAMERLKKARNVLKNMHYRGLIPKLEEQCNELEEKLKQSEEAHDRLSGISVSLKDKQDVLDKSEKELASVNAELENLSCFEAGQKLKAIEKAQHQLTEAKIKYEQARYTLGGKDSPETRLIDALSDDNANLALSTQRLNDLLKELRAEEQALDDITDSSPFFTVDAEKIISKAKTGSFLTKSLGVLAAALGVASVITILASASIWIIIFLCVLTAGSLAGFVYFALQNKRLAADLGYGKISALMEDAAEFPVVREKAKEKKRRVDSLNQRYTEEAAENKRLSESVSKRVHQYLPDDEDYNVSIRKIYAASSEIGARKAELMRAEEIYNELISEESTEELREKAKQAVTPSRPRAEVERELSFVQSKIRTLHSGIVDLEKEHSAIESKYENPSIISAKLELTEKKLDTATQQYRAICLAMEVLEESCNYMKATVAPKLAELTAGYLEMASGGKYNEITLTANLEMAYGDNGIQHNADHLSTGARDMTYLAMRFGLVELLFDDVRPFVLLDDSFISLDQKRLEQMLHLVEGLSESQQFFVFSCGDREKKVFDSQSVHYTEINLGNS